MTVGRGHITACEYLAVAVRTLLQQLEGPEEGVSELEISPYKSGWADQFMSGKRDFNEMLDLYRQEDFLFLMSCVAGSL